MFMKSLTLSILTVLILADAVLAAPPTSIRNGNNLCYFGIYALKKKEKDVEQVLSEPFTPTQKDKDLEVNNKKFGHAILPPWEQ